MNTRVEEDNDKYMGRGSIRKFRKFSRNEYWNNIGCLILTPTFVVGWSKLWEKEKGKMSQEIKLREFS